MSTLPTSCQTTRTSTTPAFISSLATKTPLPTCTRPAQIQACLICTHTQQSTFQQSQQQSHSFYRHRHHRHRQQQSRHVPSFRSSPRHDSVRIKSSFLSTSLPLKRTSATIRRRFNNVIHATMAKGNDDTVEDSTPANNVTSSVSLSEQTTAMTTTNDMDTDSETDMVDGRPYWAPPWLPDFILKLRNHPWAQLCVLLPLYAVHLFLFSTKGWKFKSALIPNRKNLFQSIGYDSIAGAVVATIFLVWRRWALRKRAELQQSKATTTSSTAAAVTTTVTQTSSVVVDESGVESGSDDDGSEISEIANTSESDSAVNNKTKGSNILSNLLRVDDPPWHVPREAKRKIGQTTLLLFVAYLASGYGAVFSEQILYLLAGSGVPLTVATTRAWKVLLGHLMWVYMGIGILRRLKPFFPEKGTWLRWKWRRSNWLWWAIGGYYVSALFFNIADVVNQLALPSSLFEEETVVSKLINPENKDRVAMAIGSIGPCVSAPVFEEVLYRGFLLPALACFLPMWAAIPASSVLFAVHHLNPTMIVPLSMLGFIWAILYAKSGNLLVTILIHAMWNSRVFLGSLLGLGTFTDFE